MLLLAVIRLMRTGGTPTRTLAGLADYRAGGSFGTWFIPTLILLSALQDRLFGFQDLPIEQLGLVAGFFGLLSSALSGAPVSTFRDLGFSLLSLMVSTGLLVQFISHPPEVLISPVVAVASLIPFAMTIAIGVGLNALRLFALPRIGVGILGAVDLLRFFANPEPLTSPLLNFGPELFVLILVSIALGFVGSAAPDLTLSLTAVAVSVFQIGLPVSIWFQSEGRAAVDLTPLAVVTCCVAGTLTIPILRGVFDNLLEILRRA